MRRGRRLGRPGSRGDGLDAGQRRGRPGGRRPDAHPRGGDRLRLRRLQHLHGRLRARRRLDLDRPAGGDADGLRGAEDGRRGRLHARCSSRRMPGRSTATSSSSPPAARRRSASPARARTTGTTRAWSKSAARPDVHSPRDAGLPRSGLLLPRARLRRRCAGPGGGRGAGAGRALRARRPARRAQEEDCGHGEPYEPIDVDAILDEHEVALAGPLGHDRPGRDRSRRRRPRRGLFELPPRLPGRRARPGLRLRAVGGAASPRARSRPSTPTSSPSPPIPAGSRSSTGSTTPSTTGTTRTRATGR